MILQVAAGILIAAAVLGVIAFGLIMQDQVRGLSSEGWWIAGFGILVALAIIVMAA